MLAMVVLLGLGEELWSRFIPKYLELLGASAWVIAFYGTLRDFLDAVYQYPGGWVADRVGPRRALALFAMMAAIGYCVYAVSGHWVGILIGTIFVMAWGSLTTPAIFAIIGESLPKTRRATGFGLQSIVKRIPIVLGPVMGGALVAAFGFYRGIRVGLLATIAFAVIAVAIVLKLYAEKISIPFERAKFRMHWNEMDRSLKRLLVADCFARWAEGIPDVFIVLYALNVLRVSPLEFGWLTGIQMLTSILVYIPIAKLADRLNRKPFVLLTFAFFALFPFALATATSFPLIVCAFIVGGLREIGEPARKALIVDLAKETTRGRAIGMYYLIRGMVVFPASIIGGWFWTINKQLPMYSAFVIGIIGFGFYAIFGPAEKRNPS